MSQACIGYVADSQPNIKVIHQDRAGYGIAHIPNRGVTEDYTAPAYVGWLGALVEYTKRQSDRVRPLRKNKLPPVSQATGGSRRQASEIRGPARKIESCPCSNRSPEASSYSPYNSFRTESPSHGSPRKRHEALVTQCFTCRVLQYENASKGKRLLHVFDPPM